MSSKWLTTMKPSFREEWSALPPKEVKQIFEKIELLERDPSPDGKVKRQLKHIDPHLHRIRFGDYRIFYTYEAPYISLLALRRRNEDTYDEDLDVEFLGGFNPDVQKSGTYKTSQVSWQQLSPTSWQPEQSKLPEPITEEMLVGLRIPQQYYSQLLSLQTEDDLLNCSIAEDIKSKLLEYIYPKPLDQVIQQPDYVVSNINDLLRFKEGDLIDFLLKLSPEQEKYVSWAINATGPTLLKGGPGTGKSTIALYRVRAFIQDLRKQGRDTVRILFTTYTNALIKSSEQLLQQLLGDEIHAVEVQTADKIAMQLLSKAGGAPKLLDDRDTRDLLQRSVKSAPFNGTVQQKQGKRQFSQQLRLDYLQQEIDQVIVARQIYTLKEYDAAQRTGRKVRFNAMQRRAVWSVYETFQRLLQQQNKITWRQARSMAEAYVTQGAVSLLYDAVGIDEAQDLDPSELRLLLQLCKQPNRVFITADANQSIYGSGFNWTDVHEDLRFTGRTAVLHANYRSTREIGEAAQAYLAGGALDSEPVERVYVNSGPPPVMRVVQNNTEQVQLLVNFFRQAQSAFRLGIGSCAICRFYH